MRNKAVITAISTKVAAAISEAAGVTVPVITAEDIEQGTGWAALQDAGYITEKDIGSPALWFAGYFVALHKLSPEAIEALDAECASLDSAQNMNDVVRQLTEYAELSSWPLEWFRDQPGREFGQSPQEWAAWDEDTHLAQIPRKFWPDTANGQPRDDVGADDAWTVLDVAYGHSASRQKSEFMRKISQEWNNKFVLRFVPKDFTPEGVGIAAQAERQLAGWANLRDLRDALVRDALDKGVTKTRIQQITNVSRATINRMTLTSEPRRGTV